MTQRFFFLAALLGALPPPAAGQPLAYPYAEVIGEFRNVCTEVADSDGLRARAVARGWEAGSPPAYLVDGKTPASDGPGAYTLDGDDGQVFYLERTVAARKLWLMVLDLRFTDSSGTSNLRSCTLLDEGAPNLSTSDVSRLFGTEPSVRRTPFNSIQYRWEPAATKGAEYTTIDYCAEKCVVISGLMFEAGIRDVNAAEAATEGN